MLKVYGCKITPSPTDIARYMLFNIDNGNSLVDFYTWKIQLLFILFSTCSQTYFNKDHTVFRTYK